MHFITHDLNMFCLSLCNESPHVVWAIWAKITNFKLSSRRNVIDVVAMHAQDNLFKMAY